MKVSCKYVRREIRSLTEDDREAFFQAMEIFFTIPTEVGQARYGEKFFNYERITAYHDSKVKRTKKHISERTNEDKGRYGASFMKNICAVFE